MYGWSSISSEISGLSVSSDITCPHLSRDRIMCLNFHSFVGLSSIVSHIFKLFHFISLYIVSFSCIRRPTASPFPTRKHNPTNTLSHPGQWNGASNSSTQALSYKPTDLHQPWNFTHTPHNLYGPSFSPAQAMPSWVNTITNMSLQKTSCNNLQILTPWICLLFSCFFVFSYLFILPPHVESTYIRM